jgi:hypothetical protein
MQYGSENPLSGVTLGFARHASHEARYVVIYAFSKSNE